MRKLTKKELKEMKEINKSEELIVEKYCEKEN